MIKIKILLFVGLFLINNHSFAKNSAKYDTLLLKSSQELIIMLGKTIEKYAHLDWVVGKTSYTFINLKTEENKMVILEKDGGDETIYTIDLSNVILGKNIRFKNLGKKSFSIFFDKTIAQREKERFFTTQKKKPKSKRVEIIFENKGSKVVDYDKIKENIENILVAIYKKQRLN